MTDASCGCGSPTGTESVCDCEEQGECYCDSTCGCSAKVCRDNVKQYKKQVLVASFLFFFRILVAATFRFLVQSPSSLPALFGIYLPAFR